MIGGSLFTGIGGLDMGLELAGAVSSWAWQCEKDPHALAVLDDHWPGVHRYTDVRDVDERATRVDVVCGGFPCQDVSSAGKRKGLTGERSGLWWEFRRVVRKVRPRFVFVENVNSGRKAWLPVVRRSLWRIGYATVPIRVSAADVGAPHERARVFVLAYAVREQRGLQPGRRSWENGADTTVVANDGTHGDVAHAHGQGKLQPQGPVEDERRWTGNGGESLADSAGAGLERREQPQAAREALGIAASVRCSDDNWTIEPDVGRVAHGVPARVDRLRLLGNAVVPQQAALAWRTLIGMVAT